MKLVLLLLVSCLAALAGADNRCSATGNRLSQFSGRYVPVKFPCKYLALNDICGSYFVRLVPGNKYVPSKLKYQFDTAWFKVIIKPREESWSGRLTNHKARQYLLGENDNFLVKKNGNLAWDQIVSLGKNSTHVWANSLDGEFSLTIKPRYNPTAEWTFECHAPGFTPKGYPDQICGGSDPNQIKDHAQERGMTVKESFYYVALNHPSTVQQNEHCSFPSECGDDAEKQTAIKACDSKLFSPSTNDPAEEFYACAETSCGA